MTPNQFHTVMKAIGGIDRRLRRVELSLAMVMGGATVLAVLLQSGVISHG